MKTANEYLLDNDHPVPNLGVIDVNTVKMGGGADLFIVVAEPLKADHNSLQRLLRKIEVYLEFLNTDDFRRESGPATVENTNIVVKIHPESDSKVFELLEKNKQWVKNNNATLVIDERL